MSHVTGVGSIRYVNGGTESIVLLRITKVSNYLGVLQKLGGKAKVMHTVRALTLDPATSVIIKIREENQSLPFLPPSCRKMAEHAER